MGTAKTAKTIIEVDPNQPYWNKALDCFNQGLADVQAIQQVWQIMQPPALLTTLASIVGSIYADTYWNLTFMDPSHLSSSLQAALGLNKADCDKAAAYAFQKWYGLMVRANFADNSFIPKSDPVTASPDVVINGQATLTIQQLITMWNQYVYTPEPGLKNNTYGRAQSVNIQVPINQPKLRMFYVDAGFVPPPASWIEMFTFDGQETTPLVGMQTGAINPGQRCANSSSFAFTPPGSGHYCVLSLAVTEFFTNNPLTQSGNWNSQQWLHYNGAAGWHNVDVPSSNSETLKFYNQDAAPERFTFEAHCAKLPPGTVVSLECNDTDLDFPISSGEIKITRDYQVVTTQAELPPYFAGELTVRFDTPNGKPIPAGSSVDVRSSWTVPSGHQHYVQAVNQLGDIYSSSLRHPVQLPMGHFTFIGKGKNK